MKCACTVSGAGLDSNNNQNVNKKDSESYDDSDNELIIDESTDGVVEKEPLKSEAKKSLASKQGEQSKQSEHFNILTTKMKRLLHASHKIAFEFKYFHDFMCSISDNGIESNHNGTGINSSDSGSSDSDDEIMVWNFLFALSQFLKCHRAQILKFLNNFNIICNQAAVEQIPHTITRVELLLHFLISSMGICRIHIVHHRSNRTKQMD